MVFETKYYFECHITIEPVFDDHDGDDMECSRCGCCLIERDHARNGCPGPVTRLSQLKDIVSIYNFRVADLLMKKRAIDTEERSKNDTFCTGHSKDYEDIHRRMVDLIGHLQEAGFKVWRYKLEDTILDSRNEDVLGLLKD